MKNIDKINRENFRAILDALSRPGDKTKVKKIFNSYMCGVASVLLFCEVSFANQTDESLDDIKIITNANSASLQECDYLFCSSLNDVLQKVKKREFFFS
ncbi:phosphonate C-P lyase system protein PhnH [Campylobacter suis]|uniref:Uncharacterized protein n=1 Tax=Campylobacter suis TaxID=2790657 RepID=A0ABM8Q8P6_9BACT|nr:phosphonate C-P lyase system protein PhnH [Campylobacter suis]CAD7289330.1 hypothetical protein LMG8286_01760 [Campylobacter suis]